MPKFDIVLARCKRYEIEAETEDAAIKQLTHAVYHHDGNLADFDDQLVDFFTKFESGGKIEDERQDEGEAPFFDQ